MRRITFDTKPGPNLQPFSARGQTAAETHPGLPITAAPTAASRCFGQSRRHHNALDAVMR